MNLDKVACTCNNVTSRMIKEAVDTGASTFEEVQEATGAGTVCGGCIENVKQETAHFVKERQER